MTTLGSWPLAALPGYFYRIYLEEKGEPALLLALVYDKNGEREILQKLRFPIVQLDDGIAIKLTEKTLAIDSRHSA